MKALILLLASVASAQTVKTTISGVVHDGAGNLAATGTVIITPSRQWTAVAGEIVQPTAIYAPIVLGSFSIALYPNDTGLPANTYYRVDYMVQGSGRITQSWVVPTIGSVIPPPVVGVPPTPGYAFSPNQLLPLGAIIGEGLIWSGSSWIPGVEGVCQPQQVGIIVGSFVHGLNSQNVEVIFKDATGKYFEGKDWFIVDANTVAYDFDTAKTVTVCVK